MSKKVVVYHGEHRFVGYKSDVDYGGNASFSDDVHMVAYVSKKKARKLIRDYALKEGMNVCANGLHANKAPEDPNYSSEHEYLTTISPAGFLFEFGTLTHGLEEAKRVLGNISDKDMARYLEGVDRRCEEYDPF